MVSSFSARHLGNAVGDAEHPGTGGLSLRSLFDEGIYPGESSIINALLSLDYSVQVVHVAHGSASVSVQCLAASFPKTLQDDKAWVDASALGTSYCAFGATPNT